MNERLLMNSSEILIVLCGPTGIGKTRVAVELAKAFKCEIISADSRQLYMEMLIGTAVPAVEELKAVKHHFIQSHSIHQYYNASMFESEVTAFLAAYFKRNKIALMVGGSGLYIDAVCKGIDDLPTINPDIRKKWAVAYEERGLDFLVRCVSEIDPVYYSKVDRNNPKRLLKALEVHEMTGKPYSTFLKNNSKTRSFHVIKIGLELPRNILYTRINERVENMIHDGLVEEAKKLLPFQHLIQLNTVGYKELFGHFEGKLSLDEAIEKIKDHTRAYARRQITWFRRDKEIKWFDPADTANMVGYIKEQKSNIP